MGRACLRRKVLGGECAAHVLGTLHGGSDKLAFLWSQIRTRQGTVI
jgi:hypothetical protein